MPTQIGLYYPFFHFRDDAWIKLAALYWDRMYRMVPSSYRPQLQDSETVQRLSGELGFIKDHDPGYEAFQVGMDFIDLIKQHGDELTSRYSVFFRYDWPM